jgi:hypothetical protein
MSGELQVQQALFAAGDAAMGPGPAHSAERLPSAGDAWQFPLTAPACLQLLPLCLLEPHAVAPTSAPINQPLHLLLPRLPALAVCPALT